MRITSRVLNQIVSEKVASLTDFNKVVIIKEVMVKILWRKRILKIVLYLQKMHRVISGRGGGT